MPRGSARFFLVLPLKNFLQLDRGNQEGTIPLDNLEEKALGFLLQNV